MIETRELQTSDGHLRLQLDLDPPVRWVHAREAREALRSRLSRLPEAIREGAVISVAELLENAIKYRDDRGLAGEGIGIRVDLDADWLAIEVSSGIRDGADYDILRTIVDQTHLGQEESEEAFRRRVVEMFMQPDEPGCRLGLLRVRCDANFELDCERYGTSLTMRARRRLPP
jgi:hypothetical protein